MKKILIWRKITPYNELDIFCKTDYTNFFETCKVNFGKGACPNWGNKLWFQGLYSEICCEKENEIVFHDQESIDEINEKYDLIIYPMANFFSVEYRDGMPELARIFNQIKIPVYVIACGAQADRYEDLDQLVSGIGEQSKQFISSIYNTGGEFALRGYFTKEFFTKLGFDSAVVTGCPSMFQLGADFRVNDKKYEISDLKPVLNGKVKYVKEILKRYPQSVLMDQDVYFSCLFDPGYFDQGHSIKKDILFHDYLDSYSATLLSENRIKMIADMGNWFSYLRSEGFNYSIGNRIHGNIMSVLAGIPATVLAHDTRTREMAEFFNIPLYLVKKNETLGISKFEKLYSEADYSSFNATYLDKYNAYQEFLKKHGIISKINDRNEFFEHVDQRRDFETSTVNQRQFGDMAKRMKLQTPALKAGSMILAIKNRGK